MSYEINQKISFIMKFAKALHSYGAAAHGLEQALENIIKTLGLEGEFFATPTAIIASFHTSEGEKSSMTRVKPGGIDLEKMLKIDEVGDKIIAGEISIQEASLMLDKIISAPNLYPCWLEALAYGIIAGAVSIFFGAGVNEIIISSIIGFILGLLAVSFSFHPQTSRFFEFFAAFLASILTMLCYKLMPFFSVELVTLASIIVFVPGLSLTISITELATENLAAGTARLMQAIMVFLKLCFGVILGTSIYHGIFKESTLGALVQNPLPYSYIWIAIILAAFAFTILFRAKLKDYFWILLASLIGYLSSFVGSKLLGGDAMMGAFLGGFMVGISANLYARYIKHPAAMIFMPGLILLVPGSIGFRGLSFLVEKNTVAGIDTTFQMLMIAVALVGGLLLASILVVPKRSL